MTKRMNRGITGNEIMDLVRDETGFKNLKNVWIIGLNKNKMRNEYGQVLGNYGDGNLTHSPAVRKLVKECLKNGKYYTNIHCNGEVFVILAVNGASFNKFDDDTIILNKDGSLFSCEELMWCSNIHTYISMLEHF